MDDRSGLLSSKEYRLKLAKAIKHYLDSKALTRKDLVRKNLSKATIDKVFQGEFSESTLTKLESILGTSFDAKSSGNSLGVMQAAKQWGGYILDSIAHLQGKYLCVRPIFNGSPNLNAYIIDIQWSESDRCLKFEERMRFDAQYSQRGVIYIPFGIPFLNLVSTDMGNIRTIQVCHPDQNGICRGVINTLSNPKGAIFIPAVAPIVLRQLIGDEQPEVGLITPEHKSYERYLREIKLVVDDDFARFVPPPQAPEDRRRSIAVVKPA
jgi:hypothetical protein